MREVFKEQNNTRISVDAKKRELVGNFKNNGATWCINPIEVNAYDFKSLASGVFILYGIYNIENHKGFIVGGTSYNTAEFEVKALAKFWETKTKTGLRVKSILDETLNEKGIKISGAEMKNVNVNMMYYLNGITQFLLLKIGFNF